MSYIFAILIWMLLIPIFLIDNIKIKFVIYVIQIILLIEQCIYIYFKFKK